MSAIERTTIYVELEDERVDVWRPVEAERIAADLYRIVGANPDPENERWAFSTGQVVRCVRREFSDGSHLVAVEVGDEQ